MNAVLGLALLFGVYIAVKFLQDQWNEWGGAFDRWQKGLPLRASELRARQFREESEARQRRKSEVRKAYEANPSLLREISFRAQLIELAIDGDIRSEVINRSGGRCAACDRQIRRRSTLHVDHIKPKIHHPHLEFLSSNLQVLCSKCNLHKHAYDGDDWCEVIFQRRKAAAKRAKARRERREA